jgi:hypothetical protein
MNEILVFVIKIFILVVILIILYNYSNSIDPQSEINKEGFKCDLDKQNIDDMVIINRDPSYIKYINKLIDDKNFMFTDKQLDVLKNPNQFYNVDPKNSDIQNISYKMYQDCKNKLDSPVGLSNSYFDGVNNKYMYPNDRKTLSTNSDSDLSSEEQLELNSSNEYNKIIKTFENNIKNTIKPDCVNSCVMSDPKYLKDYYLDMYGNRIMSTLTDYFADYYTNINNNQQKEAIPVTTQKRTSEFIIPDQYTIQNYFTNAYNVDWSRVVNPYTIY